MGKLAIFNSKLLVYQRVRNNENPREIKLVMGKTVRRYWENHRIDRGSSSHVTFRVIENIQQIPSPVPSFVI